MVLKKLKECILTFMPILTCLSWIIRKLTYKKCNIMSIVLYTKHRVPHVKVNKVIWPRELEKRTNFKK